jgi:hypothetical protein
VHTAMRHPVSPQLLPLPSKLHMIWVCSKMRKQWVMQDVQANHKNKHPFHLP